MNPDGTPPGKPPWLKDILNGFLAWVIAFIAYMLPAFVVGFSMGFDLGPKLNDSAEVSKRIGLAISEMYRTSLSLSIGYIVVLALMVFWRSRSMTKRVSEKTMWHGAVIGGTAAILTAAAMASFGAGLRILIPVLASLAAGVWGGRRRAASNVAL